MAVRVRPNTTATHKSVDYYADVNELVDHLRSTYPQYARLPLFIFTKRVHQTLRSLGKANNDVSDYSNGREQKETIPGKKRKEFDESEVKLRNKRRNSVELNHSKSFSLYSAASCSGSVSSLEDRVTTSGGRWNLRENYCDISKKSGGVEGSRETVVLNQKGEDGTEFGEGKEGDGRGSLNNGPKFKDLGDEGSYLSIDRGIGGAFLSSRGDAASPLAWNP